MNLFLKLLARVLPLSLCMFSFPALANWDETLGVSMRQFTVAEYDRAGRQIVREQGWLPGLAGRIAFSTAPWTLFGEAGFYSRDIGYRGQTQTGIPITSTTATGITQFNAGMAYAATDATSLFAAVEWERWRRNINGVGNVKGLQERTTTHRLLLGVETRHAWSPYGTIGASAAVVLGRPEQLRVGFSGVLDEASFRIRSATGLRLGLSLRPQAWPALEWVVDVDRIRVGRSTDAPVSRNGTYAGTVAQPEHVKRAISVGMRYRF